VTPLEYKELTSIQKKVKAGLKHSFIPTNGVDEDSMVQKLAAQVKEQKIDEKAVKVYEALEDEIDSGELAFKLISMLLTETNSKGGNKQIGIPKDQLDRVLKEMQNSQDSKKRLKRRGSNRRRRGGNNKKRRSNSSRRRN
jgi:hypothetical protein